MDLFPILSLIVITVTIIADNALKNKKTSARGYIIN